MAENPHKKIETEEDLRSALGVNSVSELSNDPQAFERMVEIARHLTPENLRAMLISIPELRAGLSDAIGSISNVGVSLEETKRHRWTVLQNMAAAGTLNADQVLEAMRIIAAIEEKEKINWNAIFQNVVKGLGFLAMFGVAILIALGGGRGGRS
jgi:hypothetical protein